MIEEKNKLVFACDFDETVDKWMKGFENCLKHIKAYDSSIQEFKRNEQIIMDKIEIKGPKQRSKQTNIIDALTSIRHK